MRRIPEAPACHAAARPITALNRTIAKVQNIQEIDSHTAERPHLPFFSKSLATRIDLNVLALPLPIQNPTCLESHHCNGSQESNRVGNVPTSAGVASLLAAFQGTGGVVRGNELAMMLEGLKVGNVSSLGRAMASGEICSFQWRSAFWIPMFQFDLDNLAFKRGPRKILRELNDVFDEWTLTAWFAQPNAWLDGHKPVDMLAFNLPAVHEAARADRYVATG